MIKNTSNITTLFFTLKLPSNFFWPQYGRYLHAIVFIYLLFPTSAYTQIDVSARLNNNDILIGDQVELQLLINHDADVVVKDIQFSIIDSTKVIEIIDPGKLDTVSNNDGFLLTRNLMLTSFDSGFHWVPPIPVIFEQNGSINIINTERLSLEVRTIQITEDSLTIAPIKPIITEPRNFWDILPYLAIVLMIVAAIIYLTQRKPETPKEVPSRVIPSHTIALDKLKLLRESQLWQKGEIKKFQSELTRIVRQYLENRFDIPALESTTDEIIKKVQQLDIHRGWSAKLKNMFQVADLVKFAKASPPDDFHNKVLDDAKSFILDTKSEEEIEVDLPPMVQNESQPAASIAPNKGIYANFWERLAAFLIDSLILSALSCIPIFILIFLIANYEINVWYFLLVYIGPFILILAYYIYFESRLGATPGKMALKIKVVDFNFEKITATRASGRFFGRILSGILGIGYILIFFTSRKQSLHDMMSGCLVIKKS